MSNSTALLIPVLPSADIKRDVTWYENYCGFKVDFGNDTYAGLSRESIKIHLQWHANSPNDPILGGSVIKLFIEDIEQYQQEFIKRGTIPKSELKPTAWGTKEFGFYDLNNNAIFIVEDL